MKVVTLVLAGGFVMMNLCGSAQAAKAVHAVAIAPAAVKLCLPPKTPTPPPSTPPANPGSGTELPGGG